MIVMIRASDEISKFSKPVAEISNEQGKQKNTAAAGCIKEPATAAFFHSITAGKPEISRYQKKTQKPDDIVPFVINCQLKRQNGFCHAEYENQQTNHSPKLFF